MSLSPDRRAIADRAIQKTFEQASVAWQALPHWDTQDPAQALIRNDVIFSFKAGRPVELQEGPFDLDPLEPQPLTTRFRLTLAQATAPTPDALLASVIARTVTLARKFDDTVVNQLIEPYNGGAARIAGDGRSDWLIPWDAVAAKAAAKGAAAEQATPQNILQQLLLGRTRLEDSGYRAPCCLITSTEHYNNLNGWIDGDVAFHKLLAGANVDSVHRTARLDKAVGGAAATLMLGRMQKFPEGNASGVSPGEEPVDLAISVPPSLEVIGENADGNVELAIRIRFATRVKDQRGIVVLHT
jgi:hypothetical protein